MTAPAPSIEVAFDVGNQLGEGPLWDHRVAELVWVDIDAGQLWSGPAGGPARIVVSVDGALAAVALGTGFHLSPRDRYGCRAFRSRDRRDELVDRFAADGTRLNDGAVDGAGRWWIGSMALDHGPGKGSLYRLAADGRDEV